MAHRPGRRRRQQRDHLLRPHQLLRDAALAPAGAGPLAGGRPDGHAARRAEPGEPGQPARRGQEREAPELRQPALRLVLREAHGRGLPRRATRTTTRPSARWRTSTRPAWTTCSLLPHLVRAQQRGAHDRRRRRRGSPSFAAVERYFGPIPANPDLPAWRAAGAGAGHRPRRRARSCPTPCRSSASTSATACPAYGTREFDALEVATQILAGGRGSRLYRRLVRDEQVAQDVAASRCRSSAGSSIAGRLGDGPARSRMRRPWSACSTRSSSAWRTSRSPTTSWPAPGRSSSRRSWARSRAWRRSPTGSRSTPPTSTDRSSSTSSWGATSRWTPRRIQAVCAAGLPARQPGRHHVRARGRRQEEAA